jgi:hypothetical protein
MIGRIAWSGTMLALAVVASFAQLDRASRFVPHLAGYVPAPFRGFAHQRLAEGALAVRQGDNGLEEARALIRARPIPAEHLALLSQSALMVGDMKLAIAALEQAAVRGWREPMSQGAAAQAALLSGDAQAASRRIAALYAVGKLDRATIGGMVAELTRTPQGRAALAERLAETGHWQRNFARSAGPYLDPDVLAEVTARADALRAERGCEAGSPSVLNSLLPTDCADL